MDFYKQTNLRITRNPIKDKDKYYLDQAQIKTYRSQLGQVRFNNVKPTFRKHTVCIVRDQELEWDFHACCCIRFDATEYRLYTDV